MKNNQGIQSYIFIFRSATNRVSVAMHQTGTQDRCNMLFFPHSSLQNLLYCYITLNTALRSEHQTEQPNKFFR